MSPVAEAYMKTQGLDPEKIQTLLDSIRNTANGIWHADILPEMDMGLYATYYHLGIPVIVQRLA